MSNKFDFEEKIDIAWCPGCGNFSILNIVKQAVNELNIDQKKLVMVSGIGQAAKTPQYINAHFFNGLHGRALPVAVAIKSSNPELKVIAESGDGDMYGEGGNHFIHTIRRNSDITNIIHNNMIYGLTKGQASPTSPVGLKTTLQVFGVTNEPFNPIAVAIALNADFVARAFSGDIEQTKDIIKKAIMHKGYALVDIFQPCVSFNKFNTFKWYKDHSYYLDEKYDPYDQVTAFQKALEKDKFCLGVIYINNVKRKTFEENLAAYENNREPLFKRTPDLNKIKELLDGKR
ncbi:MAG: 2-oxoacid ferredoxin oxidoreductase [Spirochaetes bacterium]|nr:2-oxoacid ferredoxin oxidoreductase [Spirochaetota bacterium]